MDTREKILTILNDNFTIAELMFFLEEYGKWNEDTVLELMSDIRSLSAPSSVDVELV